MLQPDSQNPEPTPVEVGQSLQASVEERAMRVATDLQVKMSAIVKQAVGASPRPATLSKRTGLSQSLAARVLRSIKAEGPAAVLRDMPAPQGLGMLVRAAEQLGVDGLIVANAQETVDQFEELINEFPTGRAGLHAAMAGLDESTRDRATRDAMQSVFRSMSTLLGFHAEKMVHSLVLAPGRDDPAVCDVGVLMYKTGICRYRSSSPITLFGRRLAFSDADGKSMEPLLGPAGSTDPRDYSLDPACVSAVDKIEVFKRPGLYLFTLPSDEPPLGESMNFSGACISRNSFRRGSDGETLWEWESVVPRLPARELHIHLLVHSSIEWSREPRLTSALHGLNAPSERPDDPALEFDRVESPAELLKVPTSRQHLAVPGVPGYVDSLSKVADALGGGVSQFRAYGAMVRYPVPLIAQTVWMPLEEG